MLSCIMLFLDRLEEMARLDRLMRRKEASLAVVYGRRRLGKTRLLLEWAAKYEGLYTVADQSSAEVQRRYFAQAVSTRLPAFADLEFRDWRGLLSRFAREARLTGWRGPIIFDEFPYLVLSSPELPSVLQQWTDHDAREAVLVVAVAGSSQRMMQGLVLSSDAPLYGRAREILELAPLDAVYLKEAFGQSGTIRLMEHYTAWGGVPRYWELAIEEQGPPSTRVERLVLDPLGPLHREPDRILIEEVPSALEVRPVLDAIGAGAHRVSEIAARVGRPATSISRPLERLVAMGIARREIPFGEPERKTRRSLYKIDDPFFRLWFRVVAPHRGLLASGSTQTRQELLNRYWSHLAALAWQELCIKRLPRIHASTSLAQRGPWRPASPWWKGELPEWDLVAESVDGKRLLLGECKWSARPASRGFLEKHARALRFKPAPSLPQQYARHEIIRALFVPAVAEGVPKSATHELVVSGSDILK